MKPLRPRIFFLGKFLITNSISTIGTELFLFSFACMCASFSNLCLLRKVFVSSVLSNLLA